MKKKNASDDCELRQQFPGFPGFFTFLYLAVLLFSLTNLANCRFSRFATKKFTWFSITTFFVHNQIKLPMRKSGDEKLCLSTLNTYSNI